MQQTNVKLGGRCPSCQKIVQLTKVLRLKVPSGEGWQCPKCNAIEAIPLPSAWAIATAMHFPMPDDKQHQQFIVDAWSTGEVITFIHDRPVMIPFNRSLGSMLDYFHCDLAELKAGGRTYIFPTEPISGTPKFHAAIADLVRSAKEPDTVPLQEVCTREIWYTSVGQPGGCTITSDDPQDLWDSIPDHWLRLHGRITSDRRWEWNGAAPAYDLKGNTLYRLRAMILRSE